MFEYVSVREMANRWEISERRIQKLCGENRIDGGAAFWAFMDDTKIDKKAGRFKEEKR